MKALLRPNLIIECSLHFLLQYRTKKLYVLAFSLLLRLPEKGQAAKMKKGQSEPVVDFLVALREQKCTEVVKRANSFLPQPKCSIMALKDFFYIQAYISVSVCIISISATLTEAGKVNKTKRSPNEDETTPQNSSKFQEYQNI